MNSRSTYGRSTRAGNVASAGVVIALHVAVLFALLQLAPVRSALTSMAPIMVSLITPPAPRPDVLPEPIPPKPRPVPPRAAPRPAVTSTVTPAPAPEIAPPPAPTPLPPMEAPPAPPAPVAAPPAPVVVAPAPAPPAPVTPPRFDAAYLNNPPPAYPAMARRMGEEGKVILRVLVSERGSPDEVQIRTSSGSSRLDSVALETVRQWKFVPARRGDQPVSAWVLVPVSFSLRS